MTQYKGGEVKETSLTGVRQIHRGKNKGKFQAFTWRGKMCFYGPVRDTILQAYVDANLTPQQTRLYV